MEAALDPFQDDLWRLVANRQWQIETGKTSKKKINNRQEQGQS
jgi:hypothetical protein